MRLLISVLIALFFIAGSFTGAVADSAPPSFILLGRLNINQTAFEPLYLDFSKGELTSNTLIERATNISGVQSAALTWSNATPVLTITEYPLIDEAVLTGYEYTSATTLFANLHIDGSFCTPETVSNVFTNLLGLLYRESYQEALVFIETNHFDSALNTLKATFKLVPGPKYELRQIIITGIKALDHNTITRSMKNQESFGIFYSGNFQTENFSSDSNRIIETYHNKGYMDFTVNRYVWTTEADRDNKTKYVNVFLDVSEGPLYRNGRLDINGNEALTINDLRSKLVYQTSADYSLQVIKAVTNSIYHEYLERGYARARVRFTSEKDATNSIIHTSISIKEGKVSNIDKIIIRGNRKIREEVILRELSARPGALANLDVLERSRRKLLQTQFFSKVSFTYKDSSSDDLVLLYVDVEESKTGFLTVGFGYGTERGVSVGLSIAEYNLFQTGNRLVLSGELGTLIRSAKINFINNWFFGLPLSMAFGFGYENKDFLNIPTDNSQTGKLDNSSFNYIASPYSIPYSYQNSASYTRSLYYPSIEGHFRLSDFWKVGFYGGTFIKRYQGNNIKYPLWYGENGWAFDQDLYTNLQNGYTFKNLAALSVGYNDCDDVLMPQTGIKFSFIMYSAGGIIGGHNHYLKPLLDFSCYTTPFNKLTLAFNLSSTVLLSQIGYSNAVFDRSDMLYFDGFEEMRGWFYYPKLGIGKTLLSGEVRYQIIKELYLVAFGDLGNLFSSERLWPLTQDGFLASFGAGIAINIPFLPIRFYIARQAFYDQTQRNWRLAFSDSLFANFVPVVSIKSTF